MGHRTTAAHLLVMGNNTLVSISKVGECVVWNCETGKPLSKLMCPGRNRSSGLASLPGVVRCACVLKDNNTFVCGGTYVVFGHFKREKRLELKSMNNDCPARVSCVCALEDKRFATGSCTEICVYGSDTCLQTIKFQVPDVYTGDTACTQLAELRDNRLVSGHKNNTLRVWDTTTGWLLSCIHVQGTHLPITLLFAICGGFAFVSASKANRGILNVWSAETYKAMPSFFEDHVTAYPDSNIVSALAFGDNRIAMIKANCTVAIWVYGNSRFYGTCKWSPNIRLVCHRKTVSCILPLQDGRFATGGVDDEIVIWGNGTKYRSNKLKNNYYLECMAELPDGRIVCAYNRDRFLGLRVFA